jgi:hypothetical protein
VDHGDLRQRGAYRKNSESPEQDKWFRERRALLEADPEWHDGTIIEDKP